MPAKRAVRGDDSKTVNLRLKSELRRVGLTQKAVALEVGIDQSQVSRFPRERTLRVENLLALLTVCAKHGIDLSFVFGGVPAGIRAETSTLADELAAKLLPKLRQHVGPGTGNK